MSEVTTSRLGKMLDKAKNQGKPTPYLRNINVRWFEFDLTDIQTILVNENEANAFVVNQGDILVCEGGEPGRCAIWQGPDSVYVFQKALHRVRVGPSLIPEWLCYCLKAAADSGDLADLFTGTTIKHLTGVSLSQFEFPLPSLDEQREIVRRVEMLLAFADRLERHSQNAQMQMERIMPAVLDKTFRGELVTQDPNEEPASVLLERIRLNKMDQKSNAKLQIRESTVRNEVKSKGEELMLTRLDIQTSHLSSILKIHGPLKPEALWLASQLEIDDFYDQLKEEEANNLLKEVRDESTNLSRLLEAV